MNLEITIKVPLGFDASITRQVTGTESEDAFAPPPPAIPESLADRISHTTGGGTDEESERGHDGGNGARHATLDDDAPPSLEQLGLEGGTSAEPLPPRIVERIARSTPGDAEPPGLEQVDLDALGSAVEAGVGPPSMADLEAMGPGSGPSTGKQPPSRGPRRQKSKEEEKAGA